MGPAQHGKRTWTLFACTAVLCTAPLPAVADDAPASPSAHSYTAELPDGQRLSITVELPEMPVPALPDEDAGGGRAQQHDAPAADREPAKHRQPAGEKRHFDEAPEKERAQKPAVPWAEERFAEPPAAVPSGRETVADTRPDDRSEPVGPGDGTNAPEHRDYRSTAMILPVLTLGAGLASIGLGLGFLAIRLRRH